MTPLAASPIALTTTLHPSATHTTAEIDQALERACKRIAPTWPLDRFIAVNPLWGMIDAPIFSVSAELAALSGTRLLMPRAWFREQWQRGLIRSEHLREAIAQLGLFTSETHLRSLLERDEAPVLRRPRVMDVVDQQRDLVREASWRDFVTNSVSQLCASYFDEGQAQVPSPADEGLYTSWRRQAVHDRSPALRMGLGQYRQLAREFPATATEMIARALCELDVPQHELEPYLTGLLLDLNGWAAWCAHRRWTARLSGADDHQIRELLAIRLAWEWTLLRAGGRELACRWRAAVETWPKVDAAARIAQADDWLLQRALEIAWQQPICRRLEEGLAAPAARASVSVQAVFCIDVRSEVFRRALEAESPRVQTLGFAGFFGMPIEYQPVGSTSARPQLPGLLAPHLRVTDTGTPAGLAPRRSERLAFDAAWKTFKSGPVSGFSFVESFGPFFAANLLRDAFGRARRPAERAGLSAREHEARRPRLTASIGGSLGLESRCELATQMLRAMSLTHDFARLVVLVGHGSSTRNNPHAAGLDCGACCGQTGEVNARAAASLLNEPEVRAGLAARGIEIPTSTRFVAGLHDTTTDAVTLFELDELPATHATDVAELRAWLEGAGYRARRERAARLGLEGSSDDVLRAAVEARARDWSEVRPEWGLANNAAFIVAPRERCRHIDLEGRSFLHDYRHEEDEGHAILELIMTAPMVVAHWINLQYYASTVDNQRYGSGNKVLHNVVGGHIGVFEGNGGDLRIGLPLQSLHDGERWVHTPLRLSVFIEAPREAIDAILRKHETVRQLVDNEWLYLFQLDAIEHAVHAYRERTWVRATATDV